MKRRRGVFGLLVPPVALIAAITIYVASRPKSLTDYATRVADVSDWHSANVQNPGMLEFCWLSPVEVLYAGSDDGGKFRLMKRRIDHPNEPPVALPITVPLGAQNWQLSPDGQAISYDVLKLITGMPGRGFTVLGTTMATLDGKISRPASTVGEYRVWAADSASIFNQGAPNSTTIRQIVLSTGATRIINLPILLTGSNPGAARITWYYLVDEQHRRRLLSTELGPSYHRMPPLPARSNESSDSLNLADFELVRPMAPVKRWSVPTPADSDQGYVSLSPQGDKLFWVTAKEVVPLPDRLLHSLFTGYRIRPFHEMCLKVSDLDGKHMHTIASYQMSHSTAPPSRYSALQWTPDGKKITFARDGGLYTMPAE